MNSEKTRNFHFFLRVVIMLIGIIIIAPIPGARAMEHKGAEAFNIDGGNRGSVPFPHWQHQASTASCDTCHSVFPQSRGSIAALKKDGTLKRKFVMNKLCTKCHRNKRKAGESSGPTSCNTCHIQP